MRAPLARDFLAVMFPAFPAVSLGRAVLSVAAISVTALCLIARPVSAQEAESSEFIRVADQAERSEMIFLIGPLDLPAGASHGSGAHESTVPLQVVQFPRAGWIHGFVTDMVDSTGAPLGETFLHHVNVIDPDHRELFSPISRRIMAAGPETGRKELPSSMGLPLEAGQRLLVRAVFHNPTTVDRTGLYLRIRFSFTPSQAGAARASVFPVYIDVKPPVGNKAFDLPPGVSAQSWEASPAVSGRLLAAAGHMHDHGKSLRLEDVTEGKVLWETAPVTGASGRILSIPGGSFWKKGGIPLLEDHTYRLTVTYDNPTGRLLPDGGMGTLGGIFIPEPGEVWPEAEKDHPDYLADLQHTRGLAALDPSADPKPASEETPHAGHESGQGVEKAVSEAGADHAGHGSP